MFHISWALYDMAVEYKFKTVGHIICAYSHKSEQKLDNSEVIFNLSILFLWYYYAWMLMKKCADEWVCSCSSYTKPNLFGLCLMECGGNLN